MKHTFNNGMAVGGYGAWGMGRREMEGKGAVDPRKGKTRASDLTTRGLDHSDMPKTFFFAQNWDVLSGINNCNAKLAIGLGQHQLCDCANQDGRFIRVSTQSNAQIGSYTGAIGTAVLHKGVIRGRHTIHGGNEAPRK